MKKIKVKIFGGIIITTMAFPASILAAPSISEVSGTVSDNASLTISGSDFGTKLQAAPVLWDNFESGLSGQNINDSQAVVGDWDVGAGYAVPKYSDAIKYDGNMASYHPFRSSSENASLSKNGIFPVIYMDFYLYMNYLTVPSRNYKAWRFYGDYSGDDDAYQFDYVWYCNGQSMTMYASPCQTDANDWQGMEPRWGQWMHFQVVFKESDPGVDNGTVRQYIDGILTTNETIRMTRCNSNHLNEIRVGHYWATDGVTGCSANTGGDVYIDNVYIDTTWSRVELGNAPTYAASTHREIQIPSVWSADAATVTVNQGSFTAGQQVYVYVVDFNGVVNENGYPVTIGSGGGGDTTAPGAPVELRVL